MAPHSSTLAWKIPWTEELGGLQSMGSQRVGHDWATSTFHFHALEKEMANHSSVLAWRIPGMGEPGGLPSLGSHRAGHDWSNLAAAAAALLDSLFFHCFILKSFYCCLYMYYFLSNMWFAFNSIQCILAHISRFISGNLIYHFSISSIAFLIFWTYETQLWLFWCFSFLILTSILIMNLFQWIDFYFIIGTISLLLLQPNFFNWMGHIYTKKLFIVYLKFKFS